MWLFARLSNVPQSSFLRFSDGAGKPMGAQSTDAGSGKSARDRSRDRIIALPAYLSGEFEAAGIKWISSFPGNHELGVDRASAMIALNDCESGRVSSILEGSIISAKRTAASAAVAARALHNQERATLGFIGLGLINLETFRFLRASGGQVREIHVFDLDQGRVEVFAEACRRIQPQLSVRPHRSAGEVLAATSLTSLATTAVEPHISDLSMCPPQSVVLHLSLRDLAPEVILTSSNVVDSEEHVCRANTFLDFAARDCGHREFVDCQLHEVLSGKFHPTFERSPTVFSPFGLGGLDIAVSQLVHRLARQEGVGTRIQGFFPPYWTERLEPES